MLKSTVEVHPSDDTLELYALGRLPAVKLNTIEEHLLICHPCQDRLIDIDSYLATIKQVCREHVERLKSTNPKNPGFLRWMVNVPVPIWVGALVMVTLGISVPIWMSRSGPATEIQLVTSRGESAPARTAGKVVLTVNASELPAYPVYRVSVVSAGGDDVWSGELKANGSVLAIRPDVRLAAGRYWVRVNGPNSEPIREYALRLN